MYEATWAMVRSQMERWCWPWWCRGVSTWRETTQISLGIMRGDFGHVQGRMIRVRPTCALKGYNYNAHVASPHPEIPTCQTVFVWWQAKINKCNQDRLTETLRTKWFTPTSYSHMSGGHKHIKSLCLPVNKGTSKVQRGKVYPTCGREHHKYVSLHSI